MKIAKPLLLILLGFVSFTYGQDIPTGVRYKKASEDINNRSKAALESVLADSNFPSKFFSSATMIGPTLWKAIKPDSDQTLINSKPVMVVISGKSPISAEGKGIVADNERKSFWKLLRTKYADLSSAKVRKAKPEEINYFWATIPFDIEEPFWVIETGGDRFIANFQVEAGEARLFWIDLVGDLEKLRP